MLCMSPHVVPIVELLMQCSECLPNISHVKCSVFNFLEDNATSHGKCGYKYFQLHLPIVLITLHI